MSDEARSKAAAVLGSMGGRARTPAKLKAARRNAKKGGWPPMGTVTWTTRVNGVAVGTRRRRMSRSTYHELIANLRGLEDGWSVLISMTPEAAKNLGIVPGRIGDKVSVEVMR